MKGRMSAPMTTQSVFEKSTARTSVAPAVLSEQISEIETALEVYEKCMEELNAKSAQTPPSAIELNNSLKKTRYNYETIKRAEESGKPKPVQARPSINKNWLAANLKEPEMTLFMDHLFTAERVAESEPAHFNFKNFAFPREEGFDVDEFLESRMLEEDYFL